jgi:hypothetical protein
MCVYDIFHQFLFKTTFLANWTYSISNGNYVSGYSPYWSYSKNAYDIVAWIHMDKPAWANQGNDKWMAYGDGQYHIGLWYFSITQGFYSKVVVNPNSYGCSTFSAGNGYVS